MTGPTLTTARLLLRPHTPADLDEVAALNGDAAVMGQIGLQPSTREESWQRLLRFVAHWPVMGFGHWMVRDRATDRHLGDIGLMECRRDTRPSFEGTPEAAWAFHLAAHGQGFAREAVGAMLDWADGAGIARTVAIIDPDNAPSIRLAERVGFVGAGEVTYKGAAVRFFERVTPP